MIHAEICIYQLLLDGCNFPSDGASVCTKLVQLYLAHELQPSERFWVKSTAVLDPLNSLLTLSLQSVRSADARVTQCIVACAGCIPTLSLGT